MRAILAILMSAAALPSLAAPVYVDFTVKQTSPFGETSPGAYSGSWSFDSRLIRPGRLFEDLYSGRRVDSFAFSWLGRRWNPSNVRLARLEFDEAGALRSWLIGGTLHTGSCTPFGSLDCVGLPARATDFYVAGTRLEPDLPPPEVVAVGVTPGIGDFAQAEGSFTVRPTVVSAPGALPLFGAGMFMLVFVAGRRRTR